MSIDENLDDLFAKYFAGDMSDEERENFENLINADPELVKRKVLEEELYNALNKNHIKQEYEFKELLDQIMLGSNKGTTTISKPRNLLYGMAAVILLAIISTLMWRILFPPSNLDLVGSYYAPYQVTGTFRFNDNEPLDTLSQALKSYNNMDYPATEILLTRILLSNKRNTAATFYLALSQYENSKLDQSIDNLKTLVDKENHPYYEQARWYLALFLIEQNNFSDAKKYLEMLSKDSYKSKEASELLDQITG